MKQAMISKGGQISVPANVRHRWGTLRVIVEDQGDALVIRPVPDDPIGAAVGSLKGRTPPSDELRARARNEEAVANERKWGRS